MRQPDSHRPRARLLWAVGLWAVLGAPSSESVAQVRFDAQIRPIFAENCLDCHGPDAGQRKADLRLDRDDETTRQALAPGQPDKSELLRRLVAQDPDERMPPVETGKSLSSDEIALVRQWILDGARYEEHWAYAPIESPDIPETDASTEIDRFVRAALSERGLSLAPAVQRQQLIRRVTFDLTGLPPTWAEVQAFVSDESPRAFEKVVDRLLDSPRYGERWGRHWLDIARYADTKGLSPIGVKRFEFSYTYRDYVIRAFN